MSLSLRNCHSTALNAGQSFTGTADECLSSVVSVFCNTDQNSNLIVQFSPDASNWDISVTKSVVANTPLSVKMDPKARWFRVVVQNTSASNQTFLRLQTSLIENPSSEVKVTEMPSITVDGSSIALSKDTSSVTVYPDGSSVFNVSPSTTFPVSVTAHTTQTPAQIVGVGSGVVLPVSQSGSWSVSQNALSSSTDSVKVEAGSSNIPVVLQGNNAGDLNVNISNQSNPINVSLTNTAQAFYNANVKTTPITVNNGTSVLLNVVCYNASANVRYLSFLNNGLPILRYALEPLKNLTANFTLGVVFSNDLSVKCSASASSDVDPDENDILLTLAHA